MTPFMPCALWLVQTYRYFPFFVNFREKVTLPAVLDLKPLPTTLCGTEPLHDHLTVVPFLTRRVLGENFRPRTPTFLVAANAMVADMASAAVRAATTIRVMSFRTGSSFLGRDRGGLLLIGAGSLAIRRPPCTPRGRRSPAA